MTKPSIIDDTIPLEIRIFVDPSTNVFAIQDTGIGMTKAELVKYLGTIAHSGTRAFVQKLREEGTTHGGDKETWIGQFGVGFYSSFMVGNEIRVYSKSNEDGSAHEWLATHPGSYQIAEAEHVQRGTKVVLKLKDSCKQFSEKAHVAEVIKRYSNFVNFPIYLNDERINTVQALWNMSPKDIKDEEYRDFYQFISDSSGQPFYRLHHVSDAPLQTKSVIYVPEQHTEKFGAELMEPGVHLYSKRVLIEAKSSRLFPRWLRFLKGVVDCEDLSLNVSRELVQDTAILKRLRDILTLRVLRWFSDEAKKDRERFNQFYREYRLFLKEGYLSDKDHKDEIGKLLQYESSIEPPSSYVSLPEYVARMKPDQKHIYYLCVSNRQFGLDSPYFEGFKDAQTEVLFCYDIMDQVLLQNMHSFEGKSLIHIETIQSEINDEATKKKAEEYQSLVDWFKETLKPIVGEVKISTRLVASPAVIISNELHAMQRVWAKINPTATIAPFPHTLEINPTHELIQQINRVRNSSPIVAKQVAEQILDNALLSAGLFEDPRSMLKRMNSLLQLALQSKTSN